MPPEDLLSATMLKGVDRMESPKVARDLSA
jgi:hypothetical protein